MVEKFCDPRNLQNSRQAPIKQSAAVWWGTSLESCPFFVRVFALQGCIVIQEVFLVLCECLLYRTVLWYRKCSLFCKSVCFTGLYCDTGSVPCFVWVFALQGCIVIQEVFLVLYDCLLYRAVLWYRKCSQMEWWLRTVVWCPGIRY